MSVPIDLNRLRHNLEQLSEFGRNRTGGITRESFSEADRQARAWLSEKLNLAGTMPRFWLKK